MTAIAPRFRRSRWVGIALVGAVLAGCSGGGQAGTDGGGANPPSAAELPDCPVDALKDATAPVEVLMWYQLNGKVKDVLLSQIDKYNASQSKVKVRAESQGSDYDELFDAYKRGIPTKALPDIVVTDETATRFLVDSGTVIAAQKCYEADHLSTDGFNQAAINYYKVGGVLYPGTASLSDLVTYYNKAQFTRAGLDPNKPPQTLDEVRRYAEVIKQKGIVDKPVTMKLASWFLETQLTGAHQSVVNNDNGHGPGRTEKATFDTDTARKIYDWVKQMTADGLLNGKADSPGQFEHLLAMSQQSASMTIETSTAVTTISAVLGGDTSVAREAGVNATTNLTKDDVGVGPVFGVTAGGKAQIGGNAWYITNAHAPAQQAGAWDLIKWWNQAPQQKVWHMEGSYLPFLNSVAQDPEVQAFWRDTFSGQMLKVAYDELATGIDPTFGGPAIGPYQQTRNILRSSLDRAALPGSNPDAIVKQAVTETDAALKTYNEGL
jgi:sn-glycerol 3-phosphate transport system substrate-binding protein